MIGLDGWRRIKYDGAYLVVDPSKVVVAAVSRDNVDPAVQKARADLITAAPKLKATLQRLAHLTAKVEAFAGVKESIPGPLVVELHDATIAARDALRESVGLL